MLNSILLYFFSSFILGVLSFKFGLSGPQFFTLQMVGIGIYLSGIMSGYKGLELQTQENKNEKN